MNQELEQYLWFFIEHRQKDWLEWLAAAEFAINNKVHTVKIADNRLGFIFSLIFLFYFYFSFIFLYLEQLGLGLIGHAVTSVTT